MNTKKPIEMRLAKKIIKGEKPNDCWEWVGGRNNIGYPFIKYGDRMRLAHRVQAELHGITGEEIQHTCGNYDCLNPRHLKAGTMRTRIDRNIKNGLYQKLSEMSSGRRPANNGNFWRTCEYCNGVYYCNQGHKHAGCKDKHLLLQKFSKEHK